jgi:hypothetical protein
MEHREQPISLPDFASLLRILSGEELELIFTHQDSAWVKKIYAMIQDEPEVFINGGGVK